MTDLQENKVSAYLALGGVLKAEENFAIWSGNEFFAEMVNDMDALLAEILEVLSVQGKNITGIALEKKQIREDLTRAAMKVVYGGVAHALIINDPDLQSGIDYSRRELTKSRDVALADKAGVIFEIAHPLREELAKRYVTEADILRVNELRNAYLDVIAAPRMAIIEKKVATDNLKVKIKAMDDLLTKRMDEVVRIYEDNEPEFVDQYFRARRIVRSGVRHTGAWVKGRVVVAGTDTGVAGARVVMPEKKRERVTDEGGYFKFLLKRRCTVSLVAEAAGFKRGVKDKIKIEPGKGVEVEVVVSTE